MQLVAAILSFAFQPGILVVSDNVSVFSIQKANEDRNMKNKKTTNNRVSSASGR